MEHQGIFMFISLIINIYSNFVYEFYVYITTGLC